MTTFLTQRPTSSDARPHLLARALAIAALVGVAVVHLVQLPDTFRQMPGLGAPCLLRWFSGLVAAALVYIDHRRLWHAATLTTAGAIGAYLLTRGLPVPFDTRDVGNWLEPLGLVALFLESSLVARCGYRLWALLRIPAQTH